MTELYPPGVRRGTVTALAVVVGVLAAAAGLFVALYLMERGDSGRLSTDITGVERELADARDRLDSVQSSVDDLDAERTGLEDELAELRECANPSKDSVVAANTGDDPGLDAAIEKMLTNCGR